MVGAVLTGGASRRMGRTKALIELDGVLMARRVADALAQAGCGSVIAYGGDPVELEPLGLPVLADRHPGSGPLGGVLGALELFAESDLHIDGVFVVACDLPGLRGGDLAGMVDAVRRHRDVDVVVARTGPSARIEPTCAIWRPRALGQLREIFDSGERALHRAIERLESCAVEIEPGAVRNINTPDDLDRYA
ncbi:MAG: molybdenum cofactor guanylyltransferase [Acidobacteriota bacterium]